MKKTLGLLTAGVLGAGVALLAPATSAVATETGGTATAKFACDGSINVTVKDWVPAPATGNAQFTGKIGSQKDIPGENALVEEGPAGPSTAIFKDEDGDNVLNIPSPLLVDTDKDKQVEEFKVEDIAKDTVWLNLTDAANGYSSTDPLAVKVANTTADECDNGDGDGDGDGNGDGDEPMDPAATIDRSCDGITVTLKNFEGGEKVNFYHDEDKPQEITVAEDWIQEGTGNLYYPVKSDVPAEDQPKWVEYDENTHVYKMTLGKTVLFEETLAYPEECNGGAGDEGDKDAEALPVTGSNIAILIGAGSLALAAGAGAVFFARRRRTAGEQA